MQTPFGVTTWFRHTVHILCRRFGFQAAALPLLYLLYNKPRPKYTPPPGRICKLLKIFIDIHRLYGYNKVI